MDVEKVWKMYTANIGLQAIIDKWYDKIIQHYREESRVYHTIQHIQSKLELFDWVQHKIQNKTAFILAIYFQYYEYNPKDFSCTDRNLERFKDFAMEAEIKDNKLCDDVSQLLRTAENITAEHSNRNVYGSTDKHYFLDMDIAVLGSLPEDYELYMKQVRDEFGFLSDQSYRNLRLKVLQTFATIPNVYTTKEFRDKLEKIAKSNIQIEINLLR